LPSLELGPFPNDPGYGDALALDRDDPLRGFANHFTPIERDLIYLDGNSLGRLPKRTPERVREAVEQEWGQRLIRSWQDRWWDLGVDLGNTLAPLVGAGPNEVVIADSTSVVLFKLTLAALRASPGRRRIVTDNLNFPTDNYITAAAAESAGNVEVVTIPSGDEIHGPVDDLITNLDEDTALLTLSHVVFKSGYLYDMERLTQAAHDVGALVLWDLSHSVGVVPIDLAGADVDLAVGCTYKYLNGGPGAPAFLYVNPAATAIIDNPLQGWWGHAAPFAFELGYRPAPSIRRFQTGTMPILSLVGAEVGISLSVDAGTPRLRSKSLALSEFFIEHSKNRLLPLGFELASPSLPERRGAHVSLRHPDGWRVTQALIKQGKVIPDFRDPDNIRFGLAPLYTSFIEAHTAIGRIQRVVNSSTYESYPDERKPVT
jgi:kynureninase